MHKALIYFTHFILLHLVTVCSLASIAYIVFVRQRLVLHALTAGGQGLVVVIQTAIVVEFFSDCI